MLELFDGFIAAVSTETHIPFHKEADGKYSAKIEFEGGRHQKVFVTLDQDDQGDPTINYHSVICKIKENDVELFKDALKMNTSLTYGAIALLNDSLIVHQTYFLRSMEPQRFLKSLSYVAAKADELEESLTAQDAD